MPGGSLVAVTVCLFAVGVWSAGKAEKVFGRVDPGQVVIDEVAGQIITFIATPRIGWMGLIAGFILFRVFDIVKPFPARQAERFPGGWGIMLDDVVAGLYSLIVLTILGRVYQMSLWKKSDKPESLAAKKGSATNKPLIERVTPRAAIPGGEISISGRGLTQNGRGRPQVRFGDQPGSLLLSSPNRLVVRVPEGVSSGDVTVDTGVAVSAPASVAVGVTIAENLHPVANPAIDAAGNTFTTFSGSRGQKVPVSVFKIDRQLVVRPFLNDLVNPTGLAFDRAGYLYVSSRMEGTIYKVSPDGHREIYAEGMGVATGIAFDRR